MGTDTPNNLDRKFNKSRSFIRQFATPIPDFSQWIHQDQSGKQFDRNTGGDNGYIFSMENVQIQSWNLYKNFHLEGGTIEDIIGNNERSQFLSAITEPTFYLQNIG